MADEVTKKDLQSLQGWVNAKFKEMEKSLEKRVQELDKSTGEMGDSAEKHADVLDTNTNKRLDRLEARLAKLEKS